VPDLTFNEFIFNFISCEVGGWVPYGRTHLFGSFWNPLTAPYLLTMALKKKARKGRRSQPLLVTRQSVLAASPHPMIGSRRPKPKPNRNE
jgi:hypothetical protein